MRKIKKLKIKRRTVMPKNIPPQKPPRGRAARKIQGTIPDTAHCENRQNPRRRQGQRRLLSSLDLPAGILSDDVHIELSGSCEMFIDGCANVSLYEEGAVTLTAGKCDITVTGTNLTLCSFSGDQLRITGKITSIIFE